MSRFARICRTFFIEEPIFRNDEETYNIKEVEENLWVVVPCLPTGLSNEDITVRMNQMVKRIINENAISKYLFWYYSPMSLLYTRDLNPSIVVYDCMDELSAFKFAPEILKELEQELFKRADIVFTGGHSLYESKKRHHHNIFPFPSSIDKKHFSAARHIHEDQPDQEHIPHPRFGFYGVVDERFDIDLLAEVAKKKPNWHFIILGPVVKIDPATLPQGQNIHYLGMKTYEQLPLYLSQWDIAMVLFARNESTQFISPTKTPEYLAAGKRVISTSIKDVVDMYGSGNMIQIADTPDDFIEAARKIFESNNYDKWLEEIDAFLSGNSWDKTWTSMLQLINMVGETKPISEKQKKEEHV